MKKLKEVLEAEIHIEVNKDLFKDFKKFVMGIYTRDDDHVKFLSGHLIGVHTPYFFATDTNYFWDSIMEVDKKHLSDEYHYPKTIIKKEWNISGSLLNNCLVWLIHLILNSKLSKDDQEEFVKDILILFQYIFLTSKIQRDYGHGAKIETATAAHDALAGHFLIKKVDSWMEYFKLRADRMWVGKGKHKDMVGILRSFDDDIAVKNVIAGIANNMNNMMKAYNRIFHALHDSGTGISMSSAITLDKEGVETTVDQMSGFSRYLRILDSRIAIREEFINDPLITLIVEQTAAREKKVKGLLEYITTHYGTEKDRNIEEYVKNGIIFAFTELYNENVVIEDIRSVVSVLLGKMSARRIGNEPFDNFEKYGNRVLKKSIGHNKHGIAARNVAIVYMVVWTLISDKE